MLRADEATRFLVLEMGARGVGHIAYLCGIAAPDIAVVLNVGHAHVGEFGDQATIGRAKSELVSALKPGGVAVLNADDPIVAAMASKAPGRVITFGESAADVQVTDLRLDQLARPSFRLVHEGKAVEVTLHLSGEHAAVNAAAAAAAALAAGLDLATVADRLSSAEPQSRWRMEVTHSSDGVVLVNDAYNANPESTRAALKSLGSDVRGWSFLGCAGRCSNWVTPVRTPTTASADLPSAWTSRLVAVVGRGRGPFTWARPTRAPGARNPPGCPTPRRLWRCCAELRPGDVVLVKASRAWAEKVVEALMDGGNLVIQVILAAGFALMVGLFGTPLLIRFLRRHGYSQAIRVSADGINYPEHQGKKGTPAWGTGDPGGVVGGGAVAHLVVWRVPTVTGLLALYLMVGLGLVGMADDYLKIFKQRSTGVGRAPNCSDRRSWRCPSRCSRFNSPTNTAGQRPPRRFPSCATPHRAADGARRCSGSGC